MFSVIQIPVFEAGPRDRSHRLRVILLRVADPAEGDTPPFDDDLADLLKQGRFVRSTRISASLQLLRARRARLLRRERSSDRWRRSPSPEHVGDRLEEIDFILR